MTTHEWDPKTYARFARERRRPYDDMLAQVGDIAPRVVVDLGCGDGLLTAELAQRWPEARVVGVEPSPQMIATARERDTDPTNVEFVRLTAQEWDPQSPGQIDLFVTNAALQWVPGHAELLPRWAEALAPGGVFAMQVPGNFDAPVHAIMRELIAAHPRAGDLLPGLDRLRDVSALLDYVRILGGAGLDVNAWETTYVHLLPNATDEHPVLTWVRGTGLRPVQQALTPDEFAAFTQEFESRLREAYPAEPFGVAMPFRRLFAVARRAG